MFSKILIANRGEIACRIMRTARRLGIATVAVYSDADARALHVEIADEAVSIGPPPATESYLSGQRIISAARATGAEAIHPGYGFLAENAFFAEACAEAGIVFIGPPPEAMRLLGDKAAAKKLAAGAAIPVVPGYSGDKQDARTLTREAGQIGFPLLIKAAGGGGGRGMRLVTAAYELSPALESARREATSAFGDDRVLLEKVVEKPRHIEVQVFGDHHGNVVHIFERDCSLQRRHQKVIEEAPAPGMSAELRQTLTAAAVTLARAAGYQNAGTVEFLVEGGILAPDAPWYFIETNTRLQVEHPVTEAITGLDLVEWQLRVAAGEPLPLGQDEVALRGHAIEVRLCAEDPAKGFGPSTGRLHCFDIPADTALRVDAGVRTGDEISPHYDSLIAKLIAHAPDRSGALLGARNALERSSVLGPFTNAGFLHALLGEPAVEAGTAATGLVGEVLERLVMRDRDGAAIAAGVHALLAAPQAVNMGVAWPDPWHATDAFQLGPPRAIERPVIANGEKVKVGITWEPGGAKVAIGSVVPSVSAGALQVLNSDGTAFVLNRMRQTVITWPSHEMAAHDHGGDALRAPINGRVVKVFVGAGATVARGDRIAVIEAMKMEHVLHAPRDGRIGQLAVKEGDQVRAGALVAALSE